MLAAMGHNYHPAMHIAGPHMIVPAGKFEDLVIYARTSECGSYQPSWQFLIM